MKHNKYSDIASSDAKETEGELLKVSFKYLSWDSEYFFFHGLEPTYYKKFFECITELQNSRERDITEQTHPSLTPKSIFNTKTSLYTCFPSEIVTKTQDSLFVETRDINISKTKALEATNRAFEVRLSKSYGRLHGFLWNKTFFIVWIDPAHNLYCGQSALQRHKEFAKVKSFSPEEVNRLKGEVHDLTKEVSELTEIING